MEHIDNLAEGCPDNSITARYKVAHDQWQLMELKCELQCPNTSHPVHHPSQLPVACPLPAAHAPFITPPPPAPAQSLPPGIPIEVCYLSPSEQKKLLLQLLAAKDAAEDPSPDASPVDLSSEVGLAAPSTGQKKDF
ncbi:hypothetical protein C0995_003200 [Termitomyces sp. Mi166|nr:hypothetical protein C0995_003200 [Termitomyces sp. Mi166\